jgi:NitT/TauT family transport system permease protein
MNELIWVHVIASLVRVVEGIFISVLIGVPAGLLLANSKKINKLFSPLLYFIYPVPKLALLPVVMLLLGIGENAKIVMIVLILVFQIIVAARDAVLHIPHEDFHVLVSLGANKRQMLRWIILPSILPEMLTSLRVSIGTALSVLFFTETFGTDKGMGFYIVDAWMRLAYTEMCVGILILSLIGFILFYTIDLLEGKICKWKY